MGCMRMTAGTELTILRVAAEAEQLLDAVRSRVEVSLDLSAVQRCDTAGVQLLMLLRRVAQRSGTRLQFEHPSPAICELLRFYRVESMLDEER